jgi:hypothetical protein
VGSLEKEMIGTQCYKKPFRKFWEHISLFYDNYIGYFMVLIPIRVSLLILVDTSCNERGISEYNRIHTASRSSLTVLKVQDLFSIKHYGPKTSADFEPEALYERWMSVIYESNGASSNTKRRNLGALLRKIARTAQEKHSETDVDVET